MSVGRKVLGVAAGAAGVAVAGGAARIAQQRRLIAHREIDSDLELGSLHSPQITVVADDGVPLHAEVDEFDQSANAGRSRRRATAAVEPPITVVFIHGYSLNLDCWHFQRAAYRGQVKSVFYDQRSHGRSGRSPDGHATIEQLGRDLKRVLDDLTHDDPVVLVGHSMGGMTILSLAEQFPELFGTKVVATALISTTAGGLDPGRILFPMLPAGIGSGLVGRVVGTLSRGHRAVDALRNRGHDLAVVVTDAYAFGPGVPEDQVQFVYDLINQTPFDVVADFYPAFASLDLWDACPVVATVPTSIISGTGDRITAIGHARKLHARTHGSDLLECDGAGHMVLIERFAQVNAELTTLFAAGIERAEER
jgi:pimeloyl-ACP methyl ester carboxylesterase